MSATDLPMSSCTCALPNGYFGRTGWHFRLMRHSDLPVEMTTRHDPEEGGPVSLPGLVIEEMFKSYRNKWIAVEKCPHYWRSAADDKLY